MKVYYEIEQRSSEWDELRWSKVTGSVVTPLLGVKKILDLSLFDEIMGKRLRDFEFTEEGFTSADMQRGIDLEPSAIEILRNETQIDFISAGFIERNSFHGHSPDAISSDETCIAEVKCPGIKNHNKYCRENIVPVEYIPQCLNAFAQSDKIKSVYFASYDPDHKVMPFFFKKINRDTLMYFKKEQGTAGYFAKKLNDRVDELGSQVELSIYELLNRVENSTKF